MARMNLCGSFLYKVVVVFHLSVHCKICYMFFERTLCIALNDMVATFRNYQVKKTRSCDVDAYSFEHVLAAFISFLVTKLSQTCKMFSVISQE